eukprot:scpid79808/ scgid14379/ 
MSLSSWMTSFADGGDSGGDGGSGDARSTAAGPLPTKPSSEWERTKPPSDPLYDASFTEHYVDLWDKVVKKYYQRLAASIPADEAVKFFKQHEKSQTNKKEVVDAHFKKYENTKESDICRNEELMSDMRRGENFTFVPFFRWLKEEHSSKPVVKCMERRLNRLHHRFVSLQNSGKLEEAEGLQEGAGDDTDDQRSDDEADEDLWQVVRESKMEGRIAKELSFQWEKLLTRMKYKAKISARQQEEIRSKTLDEDKIRKLISELETKGLQGFVVFLDVLRDLKRSKLLNDIKKGADIVLPDNPFDLDTFVCDIQ